MSDAAYTKLSRFECLPDIVKTRVEHQAMKDGSSQFVVRNRNNKLISVPQHNVEEALRRLGFFIEAELILLK